MTRKRLPLYCLATDARGAKIHLSRALTDAEGDVCADHAQALAVAHERFHAPLSLPARVHTPEQMTELRRIWP